MSRDLVLPVLIDHEALQLLEFLIKNGSERVIDDARSHLSLLKMLRQFHFIDLNGKDQGLNVRNRSKELVELLSDVERIRAERKKSRATRNKYGGVEGGMGMSGNFSSDGGSRYGGFGGDEASYGGYSGGVYGDGGGFGGNSSGFSDAQPRRDKFEEYDEYDEGAVAESGGRNADSAVRRETRPGASAKAKQPEAKKQEVDLFSFGDDDASAAISSPPSKQRTTLSTANDFAAPQSGGVDDDDFDDFQSASPTVTTAQKPITGILAPPPSTSTTAAPTQFAAPQPRSGAQSGNISDLFASISPPPSGTSTPGALSTVSPPTIVPQQPRSANYQAAQPNYYTSVPIVPTQQGSTAPAATTSTATGNKIGAAAKPSSGGDAFSSLLAGTSIQKSNTPTQKGLTMADMAKQKASAGIWGAPSQSTSTSTGSSLQAGGQRSGSAMDDLLG